MASQAGFAPLSSCPPFEAPVNLAGGVKPGYRADPAAVKGVSSRTAALPAAWQQCRAGSIVVRSVRGGGNGSNRVSQRRSRRRRSWHQESKAARVAEEADRERVHAKQARVSQHAAAWAACHAQRLALSLLCCLHECDGVSLEQDAAQRLARLTLDYRAGRRGHDMQSAAADGKRMETVVHATADRMRMHWKWSGSPGTASAHLTPPLPPPAPGSCTRQIPATATTSTTPLFS